MCARDVDLVTMDALQSSTTTSGPLSHNAHFLNRRRKERSLSRRPSSFSESSVQLTAGSFLAGIVVLFSLYFPFVLAPWAASETYHFAFYDYDPDLNHFDNSIWTYGTDYLLALAMGLLIASISTQNRASRTLAWRSRGLLFCYLFSVLAGGVAHQFYTTLESRNTLSFRLLWTLCVGTVTAASGFMGAIGTELAHHQDVQPNYIPILPEGFWTGFGLASTVVVLFGGFSFQRPACDIFIAGITQFPSTFYVMLLFSVGLPTLPIRMWARIMGVLGFILNAPLLPMYPLLVQYTNWSLAAVNTLLHTWLLVAWGMQGIALRHVGLALQQAAGSPPTAVPVRRTKHE